MSPSEMYFDDALEQLAERVLEGDASHGKQQDEWIACAQLEAAAAACELAAGAGHFEPPPERVMSRLERLADHWEKHGTVDGPIATFTEGGVASALQGSVLSPQSSARAWAGWTVAAAAALIAVVGWLSPIATPTPASELRAELVESGASTFVWADWALGDEGPEVTGVEGDVVWDEQAQRGVMRFSNLPANDEAVEVYQLWIVDGRGLFDSTGQSARISGGVFSFSDAQLDPDTGDYLVPFEPRLRVQGAGAFALTIEQPGGTWVSDMSRRVVIAAKS
ncbi:MAG: anti-sigma factor [Planctomycetota bacterium]